ncbi:hypothetical protein BDL97_07G073200 [Sphagnum fallax]|nr:hypothetical protein BDL97_07G073200 [Sphagnum fallax]
MGFSDFQQAQEQLLQDPNLDIIDHNPDLAHILNDPGTLGQTLDAARNPELMREMMRNTDRAMSNIEASPEGFNMLRRMYGTVQAPLLNAATMGGEGGNDLATNPFAALLGAQGVAQEHSQTQSTINTGATQLGAGFTVPNTTPLPNPWNPSATSAHGGPISQTPAGIVPTTVAGVGLPNLGRLADHGLADLGSLDSAGGMLDPDTVQQMLQNPHIQQMMQGLLSNPQFMNQEMMQSPNLLCQISSPESLEIGVLIWLHI